MIQILNHSLYKLLIILAKFYCFFIVLFIYFKQSKERRVFPIRKVVKSLRSYEFEIIYNELGKRVNETLKLPH